MVVAVTNSLYNFSDLTQEELSSCLRKSRSRILCYTVSATKVFLLHGFIFPAAAAKSLQSCLTLCDPIDGSPPGFSVLGILQARTLEWIAISFSNAGK